MVHIRHSDLLSHHLLLLGLVWLHPMLHELLRRHWLLLLLRQVLLSLLLVELLLRKRRLVMLDSLLLSR